MSNAGDLMTGNGYTETFVIAFALPAGPIIAMLFADKVQRKYLIVGGALAVSVCGLACAQMKSVFPLIVFGVLISLAGSSRFAITRIRRSCSRPRCVAAPTASSTPRTASAR